MSERDAYDSPTCRSVSSDCKSDRKEEEESSKSNVQVYVRARPLNEREKAIGVQSIIRMEDDTAWIFDEKGKEQKFKFSHCFYSVDPNAENYSGQKEVYDMVGTTVLDNVFEGFNACLLAYGQTGSGKTYTMMGQLDGDNVGCIPRLCAHLFARMEATKALRPTSFKVEASYVEIYNEKVRDLLTKGSHEGLKVRMHPEYGTYVEGLTCKVVTNMEGIIKLINKGNDRRSTAATKMNDSSSRSHAIFTLNFIQVKIMSRYNEQVQTRSIRSKIHLVDLAGSERVKHSGVQGSHFDEARNINLSLSTLGRVIECLADTRKQVNPPYRESTLTWILMNSFGGNSKTIMIATISPSKVNYDETLNTLRYASRARKVVNMTKANVLSAVRTMKDIEVEIGDLQAQLSSLPGQLLQKEEKIGELTEQLSFHQQLVEELKKHTEDQRRQWEITEKEKQEQLQREADERERLQVQYEMLSTVHEQALQTHEDKLLEISRLRSQLSEKEVEMRNQQSLIDSKLKEHETSLRELEKLSEKDQQQAEHIHRLEGSLKEIMNRHDALFESNQAQCALLRKSEERMRELEEEKGEMVQVCEQQQINLDALEVAIAHLQTAKFMLEEQGSRSKIEAMVYERAALLVARDRRSMSQALHASEAQLRRVSEQWEASKEQCQGLQQQLARQRTILSEKEAALTELGGHSRQAQQQLNYKLEHLTGEIEAKQRTIDELTMQNSDAQQLLAEVQERSANQDAKLAKALHDLSSLQECMDRQAGELQSEQAALLAKEELLAQKEDALSQCMEAKEAALRELAQQQEQLATMKSVISHLEACTSMDKGELKRLQEASTRAGQATADLKVSLAQRDATIAELKKQNVTQQLQMTREKEQRQQALIQKDSSLADIKRQHEAAMAAQQKLMQTVQQHNAQLEAVNRVMQEDAEQSGVMLATALKTIEELTSMMTQLETSVLEMKQQMQCEMLKAAEELNDRNEAMSRTQAELEVKKQDEKALLQALEDMKQELNVRLEEMRKQDKLNEEMHQSLQQHEQQVASQATQIHQMESNIADITRCNTQLQAEKQGLQEALQAQQEVNAAREQAISELERSRQQLGEQVEGLEASKAAEVAARDSSIAELRQVKAGLEQQVSELQGAISGHLGMIATLEAAQAELQQVVRQQATQLASQVGKVAQLESSEMSLESEVATLKAAQQKLRGELETKRNELSELQGTAESLNAALSSTTKSLAAKDDALATLQNDISHLRSSLQKETSDLAAKSTQVEELLEANKHLQTQLEEQVIQAHMAADLASSLQQKLEDSETLRKENEKQIEDLQHTKRQLETMSADQAKAIDARDDRIAQLEAAKGGLEHGLSSAKEDIATNAKTIEDLHTAQDQLKGQVDALTTAKKGLEQKIVQLEEELGQKLHAIAELEEDLEFQNAEVHTLNERVLALSNEVEESKKQLQLKVTEMGAMDERLVACTIQKVQLQEEKAEVQQQLEQHRCAAELLERQLESEQQTSEEVTQGLQEEISQLRREIADLCSKLDAKSDDHLKAQEAGNLLQQENQELQKAVRDRDATLGAKAKEILNLQQQMSTLQTQSQHEVTTLQDRLDLQIRSGKEVESQLTKEMSRLVEEKVAKEEQLSNQIAALENTLAAQQTKAMELEEELNALLNQLQSKESAMEELKSEGLATKDRLQGELQDTQRLLDCAKKDAERLASEREESLTRLQQMENEVKEKAALVDQLRMDKGALEADVQSKDEQLKATVGSLAVLQAEHDELQQQVELQHADAAITEDKLRQLAEEHADLTHQHHLLSAEMAHRTSRLQALETERIASIGDVTLRKEEMEKMQSRLETLTKETETLHHQVSEMMIKKAVTDHMLEQLTSDKDSLTARLREEVAGGVQKEELLSATKKELMEVTRQATIAECERNELEVQAARQRSLMEEMERTIQRLNMEKLENGHEMQKLQTLLTQKTEGMERLQETLKLHTTQLADLKSQTASLTEQLHSSELVQNTLRTQNSQLEAELKAVQEQLVSSQAALQNAIAVHTQETLAHQDETRQLQADAEELSLKMETMATEQQQNLTSLLTDKSVAEERITQLTEELSMANAQLIETRASVAKLQQEMQSMETQMACDKAEHQDQLQQLQASKEELEAELEAEQESNVTSSLSKAKEIDELRQQCQTLKESLQKAAARFELVKEKLKEEMAKNQNLREELDHKVDLLESIEDIHKQAIDNLTQRMKLQLQESPELKEIITEFMVSNLERSTAVPESPRKPEAPRKSGLLTGWFSSKTESTLAESDLPVTDRSFSSMGSAALRSSSIPVQMHRTESAKKRDPRTKWPTKTVPTDTSLQSMQSMNNSSLRFDPSEPSSGNVEEVMVLRLHNKLLETRLQETTQVMSRSLEQKYEEIHQKYQGEIQELKNHCRELLESKEKYKAMCIQLHEERASPR